MVRRPACASARTRRTRHRREPRRPPRSRPSRSSRYPSSPGPVRERSRRCPTRPPRRRRATAPRRRARAPGSVGWSSSTDHPPLRLPACRWNPSFRARIGRTGLGNLGAGAGRRTVRGSGCDAGHGGSTTERVGFEPRSGVTGQRFSRLRRRRRCVSRTASRKRTDVMGAPGESVRGCRVETCAVPVCRRLRRSAPGRVAPAGETRASVTPAGASPPMVIAIP